MKVSVVSCYRVCNQTKPGATTASNQQHGIMYADEELCSFMMNPHHQTMIDIQYFVQDLQEKGHEIIVMIGANQPEGQYYQSQLHNENFRIAHGFHIDGSIDGSIQTFMSKCGLDNAITLMHDGVVHNTHIRGSSQIDFPLTSAGLREYIEEVGLLDSSVLHSDHRGMFLDLNSRLFGKSPEKVIPHQFRTLKLDDPRLSDAYRRILHKKFEEYNVFGRVQEIAGRGKTSEWTLTDEQDYEKLDLDISQVMKHASRMCSLRKKHNTPWAKSLSTATHAIRYWSTRVDRKGIHSQDDGVLDYYFSQSDVNGKVADRTLSIRECVHQANNARRKFKDVLNDANTNGSFYELELATARVEKRFPHLTKDDDSCNIEREDRIQQ
jgi:hypothetical protein